MVENQELSLVIQDEQLLKEVQFNYEQLKEGLSTRLKKYTELVVTEDAIKAAKQDRANLNKLEKALADKGADIKQRLLGGFDIKLSELRTMVKSASNGIDKQVKTFEQQEKDAKRNQILEVYNANVKELSALVPFEKVFNEKWLNVTVSLSKASDELIASLDSIRNDLVVIDSLNVEQEIVTAVKDYYLRTMNLSSALSEKTRLEQVKANLLAIANKPKVQEVVEPIKKIEPLPMTDVTKQLQEQPKLKATFTVIGTREQLSSVREFLINNNIQYEGVK